MIEKILCAATWFDDGKIYHYQPKNITQGIIFMGLSHAHIIQMVAMIGRVKERQDLGVFEKEQGFVTSDKRFVLRDEAFEIATKANQIVEKHGNPKLLYSEDLF